jgi:hypothetical protein
VLIISVVLQLQFFTWDCKHDSMSWWKHLETEIPVLAKMGFTQVWLPPPQKAMNPVSSVVLVDFRSITEFMSCPSIQYKNGTGYDAYDLVCALFCLCYRAELTYS